MPASDYSFDTFSAWSISHWCAIAAAVVVAIAFGWLRRRWRATSAATRLDRALAAVTAVIWIIIQIVQWRSQEFSAGTSLPLHVSDLTLLAVPVALWSGWRWTRAVVYYWGLTLGSLAFLLPDLHDGPARLGFWTFWIGHIVIFAGVVYELLGRDLRPTWRDFGRAAAVSLLYAALIVPFNAVTGHSYGYLGPDQPAQPPVLRYFGAWPVRAIPVVLTGLAAMALLTLPWQIWRGARTD